LNTAKGTAAQIVGNILSARNRVIQLVQGIAAAAVGSRKQTCIGDCY
jgi:hypothetical protein